MTWTWTWPLGVGHGHEVVKSWEPSITVECYIGMEGAEGSETRMIRPGVIAGRADVGSAGGDLDELFRHQQAPMVSLARMLTGSEAIAEEIVQEAFLKLHRRPGVLENPEGYLRTTVTNLCRNHARHLAVEVRTRVRERLVLEDLALDELWGHICELPFRQRAVLALRFYNDLPEAEIAAVLDCPLGTVKSTLHRGLKELRRKLS
jgi:RNA polymerase sigma factor (sigma-70 family)